MWKYAQSVAEEELKDTAPLEYEQINSEKVKQAIAKIKHNHGFRRFFLKGLTKTEVEIGLLSIAHNLRKWKA